MLWEENAMTENREIVVKGIGSVSIPPDLLVLQMKLEVTKKEYSEAMDCAARLIA